MHATAGVVHLCGGLGQLAGRFVCVLSRRAGEATVTFTFSFAVIWSECLFFLFFFPPSSSFCYLQILTAFAGIVLTSIDNCLRNTCSYFAPLRTISLLIKLVFHPCRPVFVPSRDMTEVLINSTPMEDMRLSPSKDRLSFQVACTNTRTHSCKNPTSTLVCYLDIFKEHVLKGFDISMNRREELVHVCVGTAPTIDATWWKCQQRNVNVLFNLIQLGWRSPERAEFCLIRFASKRNIKMTC